MLFFLSCRQIVFFSLILFFLLPLFHLFLFLNTLWLELLLNGKVALGWWWWRRRRRWQCGSSDGGGFYYSDLDFLSPFLQLSFSLENASSAPFLSKSLRISSVSVSSWPVCLCFVIIIPNWPSQLLPLVWAPLGIGFSDRFFNWTAAPEQRQTGRHSHCRSILNLPFSNGFCWCCCCHCYVACYVLPCSTTPLTVATLEKRENRRTQREWGISNGKTFAEQDASL